MTGRLPPAPWQKFAQDNVAGLRPASGLAPLRQKYPEPAYSAATAPVRLLSGDPAAQSPEATRCCAHRAFCARNGHEYLVGAADIDPKKLRCCYADYFEWMVVQRNCLANDRPVTRIFFLP